MQPMTANGQNRPFEKTNKRSEYAGFVKVIASIEDPVVIRKILDHLEAKGALVDSCQLPSCRAPPELDLKTML